MTFVELVKWLATSAALGVVSTFVMQALKALFPAIRDQSAKIISVVVAALVSVGATLALPFLPQVPAWVEQFWPTLVWLASQLWYELIKPKQ